MTDECIDPIELFKIEVYHEDPEVQMRAIKRLPTLAVALDVERTRHELISCLEEFLEIIYFQNDEILSSLAIQLGKFSPFIGGAQYSHILFPMLEKLASTEDVLTRDRAVESLQHIASLMDEENLETYFIPLIRKLSTAEWFTSKCSAAGLYAICYLKLNEENRTKLRKLFFQLLKDESPMVRRATVTKMIDFLKIVDIEHVKDEFVPAFEELAHDDQDSVRLLNVNVAIAIATRLDTVEIEDYILETIEKMAADLSWRVRYQFANEIHSFQEAVGPKITRKNIVNLYKNLVRDGEANIREVSARKIVKFCEVLQQTYVHNDEGSTDLDPVIINDVFPLIKELDQDVAEDVQDALYSVITSLSSLLGEVITKDFLLPLITSSLENGSPKVKENIIANLNNIICIVDVNCLTDKVRELISELVDTNATYWRIRRNLIVTLSHIANHSKKEYFDEYLKPLYVKLLNDAVYGVRKVAPLILPVLVKNFGVAWAKESIIPTFIEFHHHTYYLFRLMCLFGIDELVNPTLQISKSDKCQRKITYLRNIEICSDNRNTIVILNKIQILNDFLQRRFRDEWIRRVLICFEDEQYFHDDIKTYAEDTIEAFTKTGNFDILPINDHEIKNQDINESYLEGLLYLTIVNFLPTIHKMAQDKVINVCLRAVNTLKRIMTFSDSLSEELDADHIAKTLQKLPKEDVEELRNSIEAKLDNREESDSERIASETQEDKQKMEVNSASDTENSLDNETIIFSQEELSSIEQIIFNTIEKPTLMNEEAVVKKQEVLTEQTEVPKAEVSTKCESADITKNNDDKNESKTNFMEY